MEWRYICVLIHVQVTVTGIDNGIWEAAVQFYINFFINIILK